MAGKKKAGENMKKGRREQCEQQIRGTLTVRVDWRRNGRAEGHRATGRQGRLTFPATLISVLRLAAQLAAHFPYYHKAIY